MKAGISWCGSDFSDAQELTSRALVYPDDKLLLIRAVAVILLGR